MSDRPSRIEEIDVVEVVDGFVIYHPARDRVHFVNHTAAVILELCDGAKTEAEIAALLQRLYELPEAPETEVAECLAQFRDEGLVSGNGIAA
jgi:PqqD family protein of HPr-rel-A system